MLRSIITYDEGCNPKLRNAVVTFDKLWTKLESKDWTLQARPKLLDSLENTVSPAFQTYLKSLPKELKATCTFLSVRNLRSTDGFDKAVSQIIRIVHADELKQALSEKKCYEFDGSMGTLRSVLEACGREVARAACEEAGLEGRPWHGATQCSFIDDSGVRCSELTEHHAYLRGLTIPPSTHRCRMLHVTLCCKHAHGGEVPIAPRFKPASHTNANPPGIVVLCGFCGRLTELAAQNDRDVTGFGPAVVKPNNGPLSSVYCHEHKPPVAGESNAAYLRVIRHKAEYDEVRDRLQRQSHRHQQLKNLERVPAIDWFEHQVIKRIRVFSTIDSRAWRVIPATIDEVNISRAARDLVDLDLNAFKKSIIYLMETTKMKQAEVARLLGTSRQRVSKALGSVPPEYRFDLLLRPSRVRLGQFGLMVTFPRKPKPKESA